MEQKYQGDPNDILNAVTLRDHGTIFMHTLCCDGPTTVTVERSERGRDTRYLRVTPSSRARIARLMFEHYWPTRGVTPGGLDYVTTTPSYR